MQHNCYTIPGLYPLTFYRKTSRYFNVRGKLKITFHFVNAVSDKREWWNRRKPGPMCFDLHALVSGRRTPRSQLLIFIFTIIIGSHRLWPVRNNDISKTWWRVSKRLESGKPTTRFNKTIPISEIVLSLLLRDARFVISVAAVVLRHVTPEQTFYFVSPAFIPETVRAHNGTRRHDEDLHTRSVGEYVIKGQ